MDATSLHRLQFAFTITYHYLFPQLTMGLGLFLVWFAYRAHFRGDRHAHAVLRFLSRLFALNFMMGVVTGIPMEFQFGTNFSRFSEAAGGIIGQTLAMEGLFAFFLESSFLYALVFGEKHLSKRAHFLSAVLVWLGSWMSAWFIIVTNAFMQHPVGHEVAADGSIALVSLSSYLTNPWAVRQYAHTMVGSVITASVVVAAIGAYYALAGRFTKEAGLLLRTGTAVGLVAAILAAFPTGDLQAKMLAKHQPITFAAMEGHFHDADGAALTLIGQPNVEEMKLDNPIEIPKLLSFMTHQRWDAPIPGLESFDRDLWPDNIPLLYYSYHLMVGIGTLLMALMLAAAIARRRGKLTTFRPLLWALFLATPLPYIANTAGWMTSELGRQPWLIYGLMRTRDGTSIGVSSGNVLFTLLGYMGLYALLSLVFLLLVSRWLGHGPSQASDVPPEAAP